MTKFISGMKTNFFKIRVSRDLIRRFARSINNLNPIHYDLKKAKEAGFNDLLAPPTLPIIFWNSIDIYWLNNYSNPLIHGSQNFQYFSPITAGESYICYITLESISQKQGKKGAMTILEHNLKGYQENSKRDCDFISETTLILINN